MLHLDSPEAATLDSQSKPSEQEGKKTLNADRRLARAATGRSVAQIEADRS
jgi:hypothetical protein